MSTDSLISTGGNAPATGATGDTAANQPDADAIKATSDEPSYDFDFRASDSQTGADIDITKDPIYEALIPVFKENNLSEEQAKAMLSGYMSKTYNSVDNLSDDEGMIFGKYKDAVAAQNAFKELERENGRLRREKHPDAPEEYTWDWAAEDEDLKDIITEDFDFSEDPLVKHMEPVFKEGKFSQEQVNMATKAWLKYQSASAVNPEEEIKALGSDAGDLIAGAQQLRDMKGFSDEERAIIENWAVTAGEVKVLNKLKDMLMKQKSIPASDDLSVPLKSSVELYAEASEIRHKPHFQSDPDLQKLYEKKMDQAVLAEEKGH